MPESSSPSSPFAGPPPGASPPLVRLRQRAAGPLERLLHAEAASGVLLLLSALVALVIANSPWASDYAAFWQTPLGVRLGPFAFERSLEWFVNDGLMVLFFFVVGLEIRLEIQQGELSEWRRAALPVAAALGGTVFPAGLYLALAGGAAIRHGWAVPMATDIAFAVGMLTLLGRRVPPALRVLLLALAVIDDLAAILVIAFFYSSGFEAGGLIVAALGFACVIALQRLGVRSKLAYVPPGILAWAGVYAGGLHPTIAGVVIGLLTPVQAWLGAGGFARETRRELDVLERSEPSSIRPSSLGPILRHVGAARREAVSPAESLISSLHPWVAFGIMPIFALANAGVYLGGTAFDAAAWQVFGAVVVGLVIGKPLGILCVSWLLLRLGVVTLPAGLGMRQLAVLGIVAGVGFTMALFIAQLAFQDPSLLGAAKLGVLVASAVAAIATLALGRLLLPAPAVKS